MTHRVRHIAALSAFHVLSLQVYSTALAAGEAATQDRAASSDYCRRVAARARSRAALDFAPEAIGQGIRVPLRQSVDPEALSAEDGYQLRAGLSLSPLNIIRGALVLSLAEKQCERHLIEQQLSETLDAGLDTFRLPALLKQRDFLRQQLPRVDAALAKAQAQLDARVITVLELRGVMDRATNIRRTLLTLERQIMAIENNLSSGEGRPALSAGSLHTLVQAYSNRAMEVERTQSAIRKLAPYSLRATGGTLFQDDLGWYGIVELRLSFGSPFQLAAESSYLDARADELRRSQGELSGRARRLARLLERSLPLFRDELALVVQQLVSVRREQRSLRQIDVPKRDYRLALLDLEATYLQGERIFLEHILSGPTR